MSAVAMRARPSSSRPMCASPSSTAIVAGTAPAAAHRSLELARDLEVARARQAVGDDRRLERDDGAARVERLADRLAERGHYRRRRKRPPTAAMPPPMTKPATAAPMSTCFWC